jgi:hypothetical protein
VLCYNATQDGKPVLAFDSDNPQEIKQMISWCKGNLGKGHGKFIGTWWIVRQRSIDVTRPNRDIVVMRHGEHTTLARMVWG